MRRHVTRRITTATHRPTTRLQNGTTLLHSDLIVTRTNHRDASPELELGINFDFDSKASFGKVLNASNVEIIFMRNKDKLQSSTEG